MSRYIKQFRFYGNDNVNNYPAGITSEKLITGQIFRDYTPIVQLGVQYQRDVPIKFFINGADNPVLSHPYGLYELDLEGKSQITSLSFDLHDQDGNLLVSEKAPLIVDIVYER